MAGPKERGGARGILVIQRPSSANSYLIEHGQINDPRITEANCSCQKEGINYKIVNLLWVLEMGAGVGQKLAEVEPR